MAEENKGEKIEKVEEKKVESNEKKEEKQAIKTENTQIGKEEKPKFEKVKKKEDTVQSGKNVKGSKKTKVKDESKKENRKGFLVRVLAIIVILLAIIGLIYLAIPTPEKAVNNMFKALKEGDIDKVNQYVSYDEISLSKEALEIDEKIEKENEKDNENILFQSLDWNIKSVNQQNDVATIEIEVTNKNYETAFKNYIQTMFQKFLNNEDISEEEEFQLLLDEIKNESVGNKTVTETINLTKTEGKWKINSDENLERALYPGLEEGINSVSSYMMIDD